MSKWSTYKSESLRLARLLVKDDSRLLDGPMLLEVLPQGVRSGGPGQSPHKQLPVLGVLFHTGRRRVGGTGKGRHCQQLVQGRGTGRHYRGAHLGREGKKVKKVYITGTPVELPKFSAIICQISIPRPWKMHYSCRNLGRSWEKRPDIGFESFFMQKSGPFIKVSLTGFIEIYSITES